MSADIAERSRINRRRKRDFRLNIPSDVEKIPKKFWHLSCFIVTMRNNLG